MIGNLEQYRIFYEVAVAGRITLAAEHLCISQPAVSQAVKLLEQTLNCRLFIRTSKGVKLTEAGEELFRYVSEGFRQFETGEKSIQKIVNLEQGRIRIGASELTLQFYLLPYLERFHQRYPDITVQVTNVPTPATLDALQKEQIDFGVVTTPFQMDAHFTVEPVKKIRDVFVAGTRFLELKNRIISYQKLENYPLICLEGNTSQRRFWDNYFEENGMTLKPDFELATSEMIVQFVLRGFGVGLVMKGFAEPYLQSGKLFEIMFDKKFPSRQICVVTNPVNTPSNACRHFLKLLQEEVML